MRWVGLSSVALLLVGGMNRGQAGDLPQEAKQDAKARFVSGQSHYNLNEFPEALVDFKEAYRLFPDAVFLYNLGQCERQLGHNEEAIRFYRNFLRAQPKAPNRQDVLHKIEEMEVALRTKQPEAEKKAVPTIAGDAVGDAAAGSVAAPVEHAHAAAPALSPKAESALPSASASEPGTNSAPMALPMTPPVGAEGARPTNGIDLVAPAPAAAPTKAPALYSRWWFWSASGAVLAGAGIGIYAATSGKAPTGPNSALGSKRVF
jgi:tetratricopeptide (TPR) repeat protein